MFGLSKFERAVTATTARLDKINGMLHYRVGMESWLRIFAQGAK